MSVLRRYRVIDAFNNGIDKLVVQIDPALDYNAEAVIPVDVTGAPTGTAGNPLVVTGAGAGGSAAATATALPPSYAEGASVPLSVDLAGTLRTTAGAGGGGGGGAATIADGADVAQGTTTDAVWSTGAGTVVGLLKAVVGAIKATLTADVTDRAARLLGHVTVDNSSIAVTGTFFQTTQPVSGTVTATGPLTDTQLRATAVPVSGAATIADGADVAEGTTSDVAWTTGAGTVIGLLKATVTAIKATLTADITDRAARLLGHVTVDNASLAVTGTFFQGTQPVSGTVTDNQGTANTVANAWPVKVTDGTTVAAVKAASTAAVAADPAQVVTISPNNTVTVNSGSVFTLTNIANTAASTAPTATQQALVVALSPNLAAAGNTKEVRSATGNAILAVAILASSTVILASNTARLGAILYNDGTAPVFVGFGQTPTTASFGLRLAPGAYYEVPFGFTGAINGIAAATGNTIRGQEFQA